jgi:hypothetical protein
VAGEPAGKEWGMDQEQEHQKEQELFDEALDRLGKSHQNLDEAEQRMAENAGSEREAEDKDSPGSES